MRPVEFLTQLKLVVRFVILLANNSVIMFQSVLDLMQRFVEAMMSEIALRDPIKDKEKAVDKERVRFEQNSFFILHSIILQNVFFVDLNSLPDRLFRSFSQIIVQTQQLVGSLVSSFFQHAEDIRQAQRLLMRTDRAIEWINWTRTRLEAFPLNMIIEKTSFDPILERVMGQQKRLSVIDGYLGEKSPILLNDLPSVHDLVSSFRNINFEPLWFSDLFSFSLSSSFPLSSTSLSMFHIDLISSSFTVCFFLFFSQSSDTDLRRLCLWI